MRRAETERKTKETQIDVALDLDHQSASEISTGIPFFDHMLNLLAYHAGIYLRLGASGDLEVDQHHTVEDAGLCLGEALKLALGDKRGIRRYGYSLTPMDESLSRTALDISGRPFLAWQVQLPVDSINGFDPYCAREFFQALVNQAGITLHIEVLAGDNPHHILESIFKGVGLALRMSLAVDAGEQEPPSTKGTLA
jgi:imidazoleglycerol-phosphate dehydratase